MATKREILEAMEAKQKKLAEIFEQAGPDLDMSKVTLLEGDTSAKLDAIRQMNDELAELKGELDRLEQAERIRVSVEQLERELAESKGVVHPASGKAAQRKPQKSLGELIVESPEYKRYIVQEQKSGSIMIDLKDFEVKALLDTVAGFPPETTRTGRIVEFPLRPIQLLDLIPTTTTAQNAVVYMEETTVTNAAAEVAEGGAYPEAALQFVERSSEVRKIAVYLPMTDEILEDVDRIQGIVNNRLVFFLRQRLDAQVLNGNGTAPNLRGILNTSGIQTQALGTDAPPDAVLKAMTKVRVTGRATPGAVVFHPNDWVEFRMLRTADGQYLWGPPSAPGPQTIWGLPVVENEVIPEGTALVGDFRNFCELSVRRGVSVEVGFINDDFVKGRRAMRADMRAAFVVYRPTAYCTVTGL